MKTSFSPDIVLPPIDQALASMMDRLLRLLPRKGYSVTLVPVNDLVPDSDNEHAWWAEGNAPSFQLSGVSCLTDEGWVYIEGVLHRFSLAKARLYYDDGSGYADDKAFLIPVTRRGYVRELVHLPPGITGLRWAPIDTIGYFVQQGLQVTRVGTVEATLRGVFRVLFDLQRFLLTKKRRNDAIKKLLHPLIRFRLWDAYHNTISFRVFDGTSRVNTDLWRAYADTLQGNLHLLEKSCRALKPSPLITVFIFLSGTAETCLKHAVRSLQNQHYPCWELIIAGNSALFELEQLDQRVRVVHEGLASAIDHAQGKYLVFMDCHALLEPQALFRLAQVFRERSADVIYSDGVLVSEDLSEVIDFVCRPAFSPELLRSYQYINHLIAFDKAFLDSLGCQEKALPEIQIYDLLLKSAEKAAAVVHIREFLYRIRERSESQERITATKAVSSNSDMLQQHIDRCGWVGHVEPHDQHIGFHRIRYTLNPELRVAVIIPTKNAGQLVKQCVDSLVRTIFDVAYDIIIIDHDSDDPESLSCFEALSTQHSLFRYRGDFNFSRINNWAVKQLSGCYSHYLFCNNDIEAINNGWLEIMTGFGQVKDVGVVGAQLIYPDRLHIQHAGVCVGLHGLAEHYGKFLPLLLLKSKDMHHGGRIALTCAHEVSAVTAACMLVRSDAFEQVGGYDELMAVGFGDVDLCLRIVQAGYRCIYSPDSSLVHHESLTRGKGGGDPHPKDTLFFRKRWKTLLEEGDPYYNSAFSTYSFLWEYADPLPCSILPEVRVWKRSR